MPRNLLPVLVLGITALVVGCDGSESTKYPDDGRVQNNPIDNTEVGTLSGRALVGGYLAGATVWLDVNENGRLDEGEPFGESGEGGRFQLDTSSLQQDVSVAPDLDARDYPLMLLAKKGATTEEKDGSARAVEQNFLLLAPPGVNTITPFTTLIEFQRRLPGGFAVGGGVKDEVAWATEQVKQRLGAGPTGFSLHIDYLRGDNREATAYAQAIAALIAQQTDTPLEGAAPAGMLPGSGIDVLAGAVLGQVGNVVAQAAELLKAGVGSFTVADLDIPAFELPGEDPIVLYEQRLYMHPEAGPASAAANIVGTKGSIAGGAAGYIEENQSAHLRYFYDGLGRLIEIEVDGWTEPDLAQLYPLVQAGGYMARLETQYGPGLLLRYSSVPLTSETLTPRERYVFNWDAATGEPVISWHTNNNDTVPGADPEIGGDPEAQFLWDGQALSISVPAVKGPDELGVTRADAAAACGVVGALDDTDTFKPIKTYEFVSGGQAENWEFFEQCPDETATEAPDFICQRIRAPGSTLSPFADTYSNPTEVAPSLLKNSTRPVFFGGSEALVESINTYIRGAADDPDAAESAGLLSERVIHLIPEADRAASCSLTMRAPEAHVLAVTTYQHKRLSTRLAEQTGRE